MRKTRADRAKNFILSLDSKNRRKPVLKGFLAQLGLAMKEFPSKAHVLVSRTFAGSSPTQYIDEFITLVKSQIRMMGVRFAPQNIKQGVLNNLVPEKVKDKFPKVVDSMTYEKKQQNDKVVDFFKLSIAEAKRLKAAVKAA